MIKSCKATNVEFLMLKEKLGLCPYGVIYDEEEFILMPEIQDDIEELKEENEKSMKIKSSEESTEEEIEVKISEKSTEESIEMKSPKNDENMTDQYDKKFKKFKKKVQKILAIAEGNKFNHKNNIGKFRYNEINDLINNIKNNTISEIDAKKKLSTLNKIKKAEIKNKHLIPSQKEL